VMGSGDTCLVSRHGFPCLGHGSVSTLVCLVLALSQVSMSRHDSCLMSVSLSGIAKCLFCIESLTFLAESRPLGTFTNCLFTVKCSSCVCCCFIAIIFLDNCTMAMYQSQTF